MTSDAIQMELPHPGFAPVPGGNRHYVAAIKNKSGELEALRNLSLDAWSRLTPLVEIVGPKKRPETYNGETVATWVKRINIAIGTRPFFLDTLRLKPGHPTLKARKTESVLTVIYAAARKRGMAFVPVFPIGGNDSTLQMKFVSAAAACDGRGAALRYPIRRFALEPGMTHTTVLSTAIKGLGIDVECADILVDLEFLSGDEELHVDDVRDTLQEVTAVGEWRSVVLLGTSMPSTLGGGVIAEGTIGELPRREWDLWSALKLDPRVRLPTYGDSVIQHPKPPDEKGGPGMRANIRYTGKSTTLVARARGPVIQEGREQYRQLCQQLVGRSEFSGPDFSWGDAVIAECASGQIEPGWQDLWRGAGSSHHFQVVTDQLTY